MPLDNGPARIIGGAPFRAAGIVRWAGATVLRLSGTVARWVLARYRRSRLPRPSAPDRAASRAVPQCRGVGAVAGAGWPIAARRARRALAWVPVAVAGCCVVLGLRRSVHHPLDLGRGHVGWSADRANSACPGLLARSVPSRGSQVKGVMH